MRYEGAKPYAFFLEVASPVIVPREMLDEKTLKEQIPVGSGPYQYKAHMQGSTEEITRYDGFRVGGQPYITERKLTFVPPSGCSIKIIAKSKPSMLRGWLMRSSVSPGTAPVAA